MKIKLANKIIISDAPANLKAALINELRVPNPKYEAAIKQGYSAYKIPTHLFNFELTVNDDIAVPRGYRLKLINMMREFGIDDYGLVDSRTMTEPLDIDASNIKLRPYQSKALSRLIMYEEGTLVAPAGSGKTIMGLSLMPMLDQRMLWITHTNPLFRQTIGSAKKIFPWMKEEDLGTIAAGKWEVGRVLTVAMNQTLIRNPAKMFQIMDKFGIVVLDEAHHAAASTFLQTLGSFNPLYIYGLTATEKRADKLENLIFQTIGPVVSKVTMEEVKEHSNIVVPTVFWKNLYSTKFESDNYQDIIKALVADTERNESIVSDVVAEARRNNICIVVTDRKVHAKILFDAIRKKWSKTGIATGDYKKKEVAESVDLLKDGKITVLVATGALLGEGFDEPSLNRCFLGLPFINQTKITQILGRIQRPSLGKKDCVLYDYVDNHGMLRHQFNNSGQMACRCDVYRGLGIKIINEGDNES